MLQMKLCGDLVLRTQCAPVDSISPELLSTMDEMVEIMREQNGVGLAAPQVGILSRFLVMMDPDSETVYRMINPRISSYGVGTCTMEEGCLSVLGNDGLPVFANVTRPDSVVVEWTDETGAKKIAQMSSTTENKKKKETDHEDEKLYIHYQSPLRREMLMRNEKKKKK